MNRATDEKEQRFYTHNYAIASYIRSPQVLFVIFYWEFLYLPSQSREKFVCSKLLKNWLYNVWAYALCYYYYTLRELFKFLYTDTCNLPQSYCEENKFILCSKLKYQGSNASHNRYFIWATWQFTSLFSKKNLFGSW